MPTASTPLTLSLSKGRPQPVKGRAGWPLTAAILLALLVALLGLAPVLSHAVAQAQGTITVTNSEVENRFPEELLFRLAARSDTDIEVVRLRYRIEPEGVLAYAVPEFEPAKTINVSFVLAGNEPPGIYLPPGTIIEYWWELEDAAGNRLETEPQTVIYEDIRFDWQQASEGDITIYWYGGSSDVAQDMLQVARQTIADMSALLDTTIDFPLKVWVYASAADMRPALQRRSETFEERVITAGMRVAKDTVLMLGSAGAMDTLRHELTHIVTAAAGEGPFGSLPAWLDEGTAVYAQRSAGGFGMTFERAVARDSLLSLRSITSPPGDPAKVDLFYGQSWAVVTYLIDTYGPEKFAQLFAVFKEGATIDDALLEVYGFDQDGLEDEWRGSLGLPPRERPTPPGDEQPLPTTPPSDQEPDERPTVSGDGASPGVIIGVVLAVLALAAVVGAGGLLLARRMR